MSCVWLIFGVLGLASRVRCHEEVNRSLPLPTQVKQMLKGRSHCPTPECDFLGPAARYTGKYAIVMSGRIRVAHDMVQRLLPIIEKRYSGDVKVDWFIHTWKNESSLCELKTLEEMKMVATVITTEPVECMWSWGKSAWQNQWHGVDVAWKTLARFGRMEDYTLILKSRVDVLYYDLDFEALWRRYSASAAVEKANGHFIVFGKSQGWDVHMVGTPALVQAMAQYNVHVGLGCDSSIDSFPWQRMNRHGVWPPPDDAAQDLSLKHWATKSMMPPARGLEPRCAPLFVDIFPSEVERSMPYAINPDTEPRMGCPGRRLARANATRRRRLAARQDDTWVFAPDEVCHTHRHDVFFVSARATQHKPTDPQPPLVCPPHCDQEAPMDMKDVMAMAQNEIQDRHERDATH